MNLTRIFSAAVSGVAMMVFGQSAHAYPEFETYVELESGRPINCAMCHTHPDGPEGLKPGQIGSLQPEDLERLNRARAAFEAGQEVDNPILNEFGNHIVESMGKTRVLQVRLEPAKLAEELDAAHDIDDDGVPDVEEMLAGTHPVDPHHGPPGRLFLINLKRHAFHVVMLVIATILGMYGLVNLLHGFDRALKLGPNGEDEADEPAVR